MSSHINSTLESLVQTPSYDSTDLAIDYVYVGAGAALIAYLANGGFTDIDSFLYYQHTIKVVLARGTVGALNLIPRVRNKYQTAIKKCKEFTNYVCLFTGLIGSVLPDSFFYRGAVDTLIKEPESAAQGVINTPLVNMQSIAIHAGMVATSTYEISKNKESRSRKIFASSLLTISLGLYTYLY